MKKIVITGGHLTPALALIEQLENDKQYEIIFFGRQFSTEGSKVESTEYRQIKNRGIKFYKITAGRLQRKFTKYTAPSILKIPVGFVQSLFYLLVIRPKIVISFGSYLSCPVVISAWFLGIPTIVHEQTVRPGLANKINSIFATEIFTAWRQSAQYFNGHVEVIGNPIRKSLFKKQIADKKIRDFVNKSGKLIYITGGSLGSHAINRVVESALPKLKNYKIIHQLGTTNHQNDLEKAKKLESVNYLPVAHVEDGDIAGVLKSASIIVARSGANTVYEIAALALVAIFIPLPIAGANEQYQNAKILEKAGSAEIIEQNDLTPDVLVSKISSVMNLLSSYESKAKEFSKQIPKHSAQDLMSKISKILNEN